MFLRLLLLLVLIYLVLEIIVAFHPNAPLLSRLSFAQETRALQAANGNAFLWSQLVGIAFRTLKLTAFLYAYLWIVAYFFFNSFAFKPQPIDYSSKEDHIQLKTQDEQTIVAYHWKNPVAKYTVLFSHGNAEDIEDNRWYMKELYQLGLSVMIYDYPGYGLSPGRPSEKKAYQAHEAAFDYLTKNKMIAAENIILMGRSLGGGVALDLAIKKNIAGVILENAFTSAHRVMTSIPLLPFDRFENIHKIDQIDAPLLMIHAKKDGTVPFWHGEMLFEKAIEPKANYWVEGADHNNTFEANRDEYLKSIRGFIERID